MNKLTLMTCGLALFALDSIPAVQAGAENPLQVWDTQAILELAYLRGLGTAQLPPEFHPGTPQGQALQRSLQDHIVQLEARGNRLNGRGHYLGLAQHLRSNYIVESPAMYHEKGQPGVFEAALILNNIERSVPPLSRPDLTGMLSSQTVRHLVEQGLHNRLTRLAEEIRAEHSYRTPGVAYYSEHEAEMKRYHAFAAEHGLNLAPEGGERNVNETVATGLRTFTERLVALQERAAALFADE